MGSDRGRSNHRKSIETEYDHVEERFGPDERNMDDPSEKYEWVSEPDRPQPGSGESVHCRGESEDDWEEPESLY